MMKKKLLPFALPAFLVAMLLACEKPRPIAAMKESDVERMSFVTSLNDTIPAETISALDIHRIVEGVKIKYHEGNERRYFRYEADPGKLLKAFREMPFELNNARTDVQLMKVRFEDLKNENDYAPDESEEFWTADNEKFDAYECVKNGIKHQLIIDAKNRTILHRVVYS